MLPKKDGSRGYGEMMTSVAAIAALIYHMYVVRAILSIAR